MKIKSTISYLFLSFMLIGCMDVTGSYDNDNINSGTASSTSSVYIENQYNNYGTIVIAHSSSSISSSSAVTPASSSVMQYNTTAILNFEGNIIEVSVDKLCHVFVENKGADINTSYLMNIECYKRMSHVKDVSLGSIPSYTKKQYYTAVGGHDTSIMTIRSIREEYHDKKIVWSGNITISSYN